MAITLTPTLCDEFEYISEKDPALDKEHPDFKDSFEKYKDLGTDPILKDGQEPTRFHLMPIVDSDITTELKDVNARNGGQPYAWLAKAGAIALKRVVNLMDPTTNEEFVVKTERASGGYSQLCKEQRDLLGTDLLAELGAEVHRRSVPNED